MILDLTKCHDPSPEYLAALAYYEVSIYQCYTGTEKWLNYCLLHCSLQSGGCECEHRCKCGAEGVRRKADGRHHAVCDVCH